MRRRADVQEVDVITAPQKFAPPRNGIASAATAAGAPADPFGGLLDALAARLAPLVAELVAERLAASQPAPEPVPTGLVDKTTAARALGFKGTASLDRLTREGAPVHVVGVRRRFDVAELRRWVEARGKKPTTAPKRTTATDLGLDDEIEEIARASGLRPR